MTVPTNVSLSNALEFLHRWKNGGIVAYEGDLYHSVNIVHRSSVSHTYIDLYNILLTQAALNNFTVLCIKLLSAGANPNILDANGNTVIFYATWEKFHHIIHALACSRVGILANVNRLNNEGVSPLMYAVFHAGDNPTQAIETVRALLSANIEVDLATPNGDTALMFAVSEYCEQKKPVFIEICIQLLLRGASATHKAIDGWSAVISALSLSDDHKLIQKLYEQDRSNSKNKNQAWVHAIYLTFRTFADEEQTQSIASIEKIRYLLSSLTIESLKNIFLAALKICHEIVIKIIAPMLIDERQTLIEAVLKAINLNNFIILDVLLNIDNSQLANEIQSKISQAFLQAIKEQDSTKIRIILKHVRLPEKTMFEGIRKTENKEIKKMLQDCRPPLTPMTLSNINTRSATSAPNKISQPPLKTM